MDKADLLFEKLAISMEDFNEKAEDFFSGRAKTLPTNEEYLSAAREDAEEQKNQDYKDPMLRGGIAGGVIGVLTAASTQSKLKPLMAGAGVGAATGVGLGALIAKAIRNSGKRDTALLNDKSYAATKKLKNRYREAIGDAAWPGEDYYG